MSWQLFDRLRALFKRANIYRSEQLAQDQTDIQKISAGDGGFLDISRQGHLLQQTNLQVNRLERYKDFDQMDEVGTITLALDMYADESSLTDPEEGHSLVIKAKNKRVKEELENLFYDTLLIDNRLRPLARYLCKYGDFAAEIIPTKNRDAVQNFRFMNVYNFTRIETKFGDLVGFFYQDQLTGGPIYLHPWQVMHLRLTTYENIYHPYGRSILDGARKDFKRLRLMEDAALIYRITRAPEKRIFSIPVGNIPPREVTQYMELIARQFKKRRFIDPATGNVNERYSPLIQEDDFFLPKRADGTGPGIDTLPGAENLDEIADIEYFKKAMVSALKIPFNRVGIGDQKEPDGKSLAAISPEFAKAIQWIQREIAIGLKKVAIIHLALKGFTVDDIKNFDISMTAASAIDELYRIETWSSRMNVISQALETQAFPRKWVLRKFTTMTEDEIDELEAEQKANPPMPEEGEGGPPIPGEGLPAEVGEMVKSDDEHDQLLLEYNKFKERVEDTDKILAEDRKPKLISGFSQLVTSNEFDCLPAPGNNGALLMEYGTTEQERNDAIQWTRDLISERFSDIETQQGSETMQEAVEKSVASADSTKQNGNNGQS